MAPDTAAYNLRMKNSDSLQKAILNHIPDQAWLKDRESRYVLVNEAFLAASGLTEADVLGKTPVLVWPADWGETYMETDRRVVTTGKRLRYEEKRQGPDGQLHWYDTIKTPIHDAQGQVTGTVGISRDITDQKEMFRELLASRAQLRELSAYLQTVREKERTRISRELHDELGQSLTAIRLGLGVMEEQLSQAPEALCRSLESLKNLADATVVAVQRIASDLRPLLLDELGLAAAMEWLLESFNGRTGISQELHLPAGPPDYSPEISTALFRIVQEALTNVSRHSAATQVRVELAETKEWITLTITDNGQGMDETLLSDNASLGLIGMRERSFMLGGQLNILSRLGAGTRIEVRIPK